MICCLQLLLNGQSFLVLLLLGGGGALDGGHHDGLEDAPLDVGEVQRGPGERQLGLGQHHVAQRGTPACPGGDALLLNNPEYNRKKFDLFASVLWIRIRSES